jgi:hypothetical protein
MSAKTSILVLTTLACSSTSQGDASSTSPAASTFAAPPVLALGQTALLPTARVRFVSQRDCGNPRTQPPRPGNRTWAVELEVTNTSTHQEPVNPFYATLLDDQRFSYTTNLGGCEPLLPARFLQPRETVRGYVPYELPRSTQSVTLHYQGPNAGGASAAIARFRAEL